MSKMTKEEQDRLGAEWYERTHKNWRVGKLVQLGFSGRPRPFLHRNRRGCLDRLPDILINTARVVRAVFIMPFDKMPIADDTPWS